MQGYVCYVDRFCGTLAGLPGRLDYLAELGTTYLHLMPLLRAAAGGERRRVRGRRLPRGRPPAGHDGRPRGRRRRAARARHEPVHRPGAQPHRARARWAQGWLAGEPGVRGLLHGVPRPDDARRLRRDDPRGLPRPGARARSAGCPRPAAAPAAGSGRRSGPTSGTSTTPTPRSLAAMLGEITWLANRGIDVFRHGRRPVHVEAAGHRPARTSPRGTCCCSCCTR